MPIYKDNGKKNYFKFNKCFRLNVEEMIISYEREKAIIFLKAWKLDGLGTWEEGGGV